MIRDALEKATDELLVGRVGTGIAAAFRILVTRHSEAVSVIAKNMCSRMSDAEHVLQQTFLQVWRDACEFPPAARFTTWIYRIAMKTALAQERLQRAKDPWLLKTLLPAFDPAGRLAPSEGRWREIETKRWEELNIHGLLREVLECVEARPRAAFVLRDLLELSPEDAAAVLDTTPAVITRQAHRVRLSLRGFIDRL
jgi:RNA polymerase sigma-70 factor, ECF subfamily